jgi:hypothetical protein
MTATKKYASEAQRRSLQRSGTGKQRSSATPIRAQFPLLFSRIRKWKKKPITEADLLAFLKGDQFQFPPLQVVEYQTEARRQANWSAHPWRAVDASLD